MRGHRVGLPGRQQAHGCVCKTNRHTDSLTTTPSPPSEVAWRVGTGPAEGAGRPVPTTQGLLSALGARLSQPQPTSCGGSQWCRAGPPCSRDKRGLSCPHVTTSSLVLTSWQLSAGEGIPWGGGGPASRVTWTTAGHHRTAHSGVTTGGPQPLQAQGVGLLWLHTQCLSEAQGRVGPSRLGLGAQDGPALPTRAYDGRCTRGPGHTPLLPPHTHTFAHAHMFAHNAHTTAHILALTHICMHTHMHLQTHLHTFAYTQMLACEHTHLQTHVCTHNTCTCLHTHVYTCLHNTHLHAHTLAHHMHLCTQLHTC